MSSERRFAFYGHASFVGCHTVVELCVYAWADKGLTASLEQTQSTQQELGPDIPSLQLTVQYVATDILRVKVTDAKDRRWEVPEWLFAAGQLGSGDNMTVSEPELQYGFHYSKEPFGFEVTRNDSGAPIVNTTGHRLVFKVGC